MPFSTQKRILFLSTAAGVALWSFCSAGAEIAVTLSDAGLEAAAAMPSDMGMAMAGAEKGPPVMIITASATKVSPGEVTFLVTNASGALIHEMIVASLVDAAEPLPYVDADLRVDEEGVQVLGEVPELEPGRTGSLTLKLDEGKYLLFCNMPGHYAARMWTLLTVE